MSCGDRIFSQGTLNSFLIKTRRRKPPFKVVVQIALDLARGLTRYKGFKEGHKRILMATDSVSRVIYIEQVTIVINYEMSDSTDTYLHCVDSDWGAVTHGPFEIFRKIKGRERGEARRKFGSETTREKQT